MTDSPVQSLRAERSGSVSSAAVQKHLQKLCVPAGLPTSPCGAKQSL